jgi:GrpB-like predicted nucleotidyltransferase (UPF0157 family)
VIEIVSYDADWPRHFEEERELLARVLHPWLDGGVHHIGSTAVPGLAAKPTIDMIAGVRDFEAARDAYAPLAEHGYVHTPHRAGIAHHFSKPSYNLHLTEVGSDLWLERFAFRDALRADPALAAEYQELTLALAREHMDVGPYTVAKREFVARVLAAAGLEPGRR